MIQFEAWPKTPRLFRDVTVTEKIDGTNAAVVVDSDGAVGAQSRKRLVTPDADNHGFAKWVAQNRDFLAATLGVGRHFGEWWGQGIQRGYGQDRKRFSLFNTDKWDHLALDPECDAIGLGVVPLLRVGPMDTREIRIDLECLAEFGSVAAPGYDRPEGLCVFHHASRQVFKVTLDGDLPKDSTDGVRFADLAAAGFVSSNDDGVLVLADPPKPANVTPITAAGRTILPRDVESDSVAA